MTIHTSTGMRNYELGTGSTAAGLTGAYIFVYGGTVPADADVGIALVDNPLLAIVNAANGAVGTTPYTANGITFDAPSSAVLPKAAASTLGGPVLATGTATFMRIALGADDGVTGAMSASTTNRRMQLSIGLVGADVNVVSTSLTIGQLGGFPLDYFVIGQPTL